jgi:DMSO/TMAO reductase YedYZ heme-binding membrane subunit
MANHLTWYAARASGLVAWGLVLASIVWGLLLATRVLGRRPTPAWLLSLHRYLGALAVAFIGVHVGAILLDNYTSFGVVNVLVPFTGSWDPLAVAWGIVAMYLLLAIEITSLTRDRLSARAWRNVHLLSYVLFASATVHLVMAGTDVKAVFATTGLVLIGVLAVFGSAALYLWRSEPRDQAARRAARTRVPITTARQPSIPAPTNTNATTVNDGLNSWPPIPTRSAMPTPTVTSHAGTARRHASGADAMPVTSHPATSPTANGHSTRRNPAPSLPE